MTLEITEKRWRSYQDALSGALVEAEQAEELANDYARRLVGNLDSCARIQEALKTLYSTASEKEAELLDDVSSALEVINHNSLGLNRA